MTPHELDELMVDDDAVMAAREALCHALANQDRVGAALHGQAFTRAVRRMPAIREMAVRELVGKREDWE